MPDINEFLINTERYLKRNKRNLALFVSGLLTACALSGPDTKSSVQATVVPVTPGFSEQLIDALEYNNQPFQVAYRNLDTGVVNVLPVTGVQAMYTAQGLPGNCVRSDVAQLTVGDPLDNLPAIELQTFSDANGNEVNKRFMIWEQTGVDAGGNVLAVAEKLQIGEDNVARGTGQAAGSAVISKDGRNIQLKYIDEKCSVAPEFNAPPNLLDTLVKLASDPTEASEPEATAQAIATATSTLAPIKTEIAIPPTTTPTRIETPTATATATALWEGELTQAEIDELASQLPCTTNCIREEHFTDTFGHSYGTVAISTGKLKDIDVVDPNTKLVVGKMTVSVQMTKDANEKWKLVYIPIQGATVDKPDYNLFANVLGSIATEMGEPNNYKPISDLQEKDFLARVFRKGLVVDWMFPTDDSQEKHDIFKLFNVLWLDPTYQDKLRDFWQNSGVNQDNSNPMITFVMGLRIVSK